MLVALLTALSTMPEDLQRRCYGLGREMRRPRR